MAMRAPSSSSSAAQDPISMFNNHMHMASATSAHNAAAHPVSGAMGGGADVPVGAVAGGGFCGVKATVCTPFFRQGTCPDANCRFAHCLSELDFNAQQQLISMAGGEEFLPLHFTQNAYQNPPQQRGLFSNASGPTTPSSLNNTRSMVGVGRSALGSMGMGGNGGNHNNGANNGSSSNNGGVSSWEDVRVTLPARCHYPHAIGGTYYDYLNVKRHCAPKDIEASYRSWRGNGYKAAKAIDQTKADAMDRLVVEARLVLGNPTMRAEYDALLPLEEGTMLPPPSRMNGEDSIW